MDSQVADRVRACQATQKSKVAATATAPTPQGDVYDFVDESAKAIGTSTTRTEWSARDNETLIRRFSQEKKYPGRIYLESIFMETDELRRIFQENGKKRCIDKVKNIFKMLKRR